jgi:apolipoprotein N-acyltransferase
MNNVASLLLVLLSSGMLALSFPDGCCHFLAWVALVPLLSVLVSAGRLKGCLLSGTWGFFFFLGISHWIFGLAGIRFAHIMLLAVYLFCWHALFGLSFSLISARGSPYTALLATPAIWVLLEYLRSNFFFLALPYGLIGHSQYRQLAVIQIASVFGAYGVSFLLVMVNAGLCALVLSAFENARRKRTDRQLAVIRRAAFVSLLTALLSLTYGNSVKQRPLPQDRLKVALIQANIAQEKKWDPRFRREIIESYRELTLAASRLGPDMIIWPETATPGSIQVDRDIARELESIVRMAGCFLLTGSAQYDKFQGGATGRPGYRNSAFLIAPGTPLDRAQKYHKMRLFPFTEYLPWKKYIPWRLVQVASLSEYVRGTDFTVFERPGFVFAVTICWENLFPEHCRRFVRRGAQFIVNLTNEARFGRSAVPHQLMAISVFRAVENRRFIVRCANSGVSCIIDPFGKIVARVADSSCRDIFVRGIVVADVGLSDSRSLYTRFGNLPMAIILILLISATLWITAKKRIWNT